LFIFWPRNVNRCGALHREAVRCELCCEFSHHHPVRSRMVGRWTDAKSCRRARPSGVMT